MNSSNLEGSQPSPTQADPSSTGTAIADAIHQCDRFIGQLRSGSPDHEWDCGILSSLRALLLQGIAAKSDDDAVLSRLGSLYVKLRAGKPLANPVLASSKTMEQIFDEIFPPAIQPPTTIANSNSPTQPATNGSSPQSAVVLLTQAEASSASQPSLHARNHHGA